MALVHLASLYILGIATLATPLPKSYNKFVRKREDITFGVMEIYYPLKRNGISSLSRKSIYLTMQRSMVP
jgi:hypothetical protein